MQIDIIDHPDSPRPAHPASTVVIVRDGDAGLEVFMLRRTFTAAFASGMFVFPGGKVDEVDASTEIGDICEGLTDAHASSLLGIPSGGLAYWVASIRECFEESGVLLALDANGRWVTDGHPALERRTDVHAGRVSSARSRFQAGPPTSSPWGTVC